MSGSDKSQLDLVNSSSLYQLLGLHLTAHADGMAVSEMNPPASLCWPFDGQPHGGILFTQMDTTVAIAMLPTLGGRHTSATVSLNIQYTQRAIEPPFTCSARATHRGKTIGFGEGEIRDAGGKLIATAHGTFRLIERADTNATTAVRLPRRQSRKTP